MKEVKMREDKFGEDIYLNEYTSYENDDLCDLFATLKDRLKQAQENGLTKTYVRFASTLEPYERDSTGPVEVTVWGERALTQTEIRAEQEQKRIQALADKLKISYYEAATVDRLQNANKVEVK